MFSMQKSGNARWWDPASVRGNGTANKKRERQDCAGGKSVIPFTLLSYESHASPLHQNQHQRSLLSLLRTMSAFCLAVRRWSCSCRVKRGRWSNSFRSRKEWAKTEGHLHHLSISLSAARMCSKMEIKTKSDAVQNAHNALTTEKAVYCIYFELDVNNSTAHEFRNTWQPKHGCNWQARGASAE